MDVDVEIYILRNFCFVSVAKEYAQAQSPFFAAVERDPQRHILNDQRVFRKAFPEAPHLNPLPANGARRECLC
jgi:hypothetical protein